nr:MAG TPA: hypothetical protein [Caudoviricetes sp.]
MGCSWGESERKKGFSFPAKVSLYRFLEVNNEYRLTKRVWIVFQICLGV